MAQMRADPLNRVNFAVGVRITLGLQYSEGTSVGAYYDNLVFRVVSER